MNAVLRERLLPWLLVFPALLFATPLSPLALDPYPHLAGTGWASLALVPLAFWLCAFGSTPRAAWPFLAVLAWALISWRLAPVTDTFEARRALLVLCLLPAGVAGGATLAPAGRTMLAWLLLGLSVAWSGFALVAGPPFGFAGVLGDTGSLSQAALPGAAVGALWLARERGWRALAGALCVALFLAHVAAAPVLAGAHTLLAGLLVALWRGPQSARGRLAALAAAALLAPFAGMALRQATTGEVPIVEGVRADSTRSLGGLGVRALVWRAAVGLVGEHALFGAGPGQFQAAFPPYRDPREIELSRHGLCSELDTEVEHAHNDWLQAFTELGLPGGLLFALALTLCARAAWRRLGDERDLPLSVAALALLVNSLVHAPLWANPAAVVLAAAVFGALSAPKAAATRRAGILAAAPLFAAVPGALPLVQHGLALRTYTHMTRMFLSAAEEGRTPDPELERTLLQNSRRAEERATRFAPDAVPWLALSARGLPADVAPWDAVLARRPWMVEAWEQSGTIEARAGHVDEARRRYARALELSSTHARILRNAARLEWTLGDAASGRALVERLRASGCLDADWLRSLGTELVLERGLPGRGALLLHGKELAELVPEALHDPRRLASESGGAEADECLAQLLWARAHAAAGAFGTAVRSYRQAAQRSAARRGGTRSLAAPIYALELAAAELRAGREPEARALLQEVPVDLAAWSELPSWAQGALTELGWRRAP
jgi:O-antigen ligase